MAEGLARYVAARRVARNLTQTEMARLIGVSRSYISQIEQGNTDCPNPKIMAAIAKILRVSDEELYREAGFIQTRSKGPQSLKSQVQRLTSLLPVEIPIYNMKGEIVAQSFLPPGDLHLDCVGYLVDKSTVEAADVALRPGDILYTHPGPEQGGIMVYKDNDTMHITTAPIEGGDLLGYLVMVTRKFGGGG